PRPRLADRLRADQGPRNDDEDAPLSGAARHAGVHGAGAARGPGRAGERPVGPRAREPRAPGRGAPPGDLPALGLTRAINSPGLVSESVPKPYRTLVSALLRKIPTARPRDAGTVLRWLENPDAVSLDPREPAASPPIR